MATIKDFGLHLMKNGITNPKMILCLAYYFKAYGLVICKEDFFPKKEERFYSQSYGIQNSAVDELFNTGVTSCENTSSNSKTLFSQNELVILDLVLNAFTKLSEYELNAIISSELPYHIGRFSEESSISNESLEDFYSKHPMFFFER